MTSCSNSASPSISNRRTPCAARSSATRPTAVGRVHGHTYTAEVTVRGEADPATGMVVDLALLRSAIATVREQLDHHFLDEVPGLGLPTLENLCRFIHERLLPTVPAIASVSVGRQSSGDRCTFRPVLADRRR